MKPKKKQASSSAKSDEIPSPSPLSSSTIALAAWAAGIAFVFFHGPYLDQRAPQAALLLSYLDLLSHAGSIAESGLGKNILLATALGLLCHRAGRELFDRLGLKGATALERGLVASGLGAGIVSLFLLGSGLLGLWRPDVLRLEFGTGFTAALAVTLYRAWRARTGADAGRADQANRTDSTRLDSLSHAALVLILAAAALSLLASAAPETFFDSLVYHLALPRLYLLRGRIVPTPHNLYSGIPSGVEMLYGLALSFSDEHLAILLHFSLGWAAVLALGAWIRRFSSRRGAILGILIFALCPVVLSSSWQSGVDLGTAFFISVALLALSQALQSVEESQSRRWATIAGALIGFAFGTKYTAIPLGTMFILAHGWLRKREAKSLRDTVLMAAAAAVVFVPWLAKNACFYGDPVYPFFSSRLGSTAPANWDMFLGDAHSRNLAMALGTWNGWKTTFGLPWSIATDIYFDYRVSLAYLMIVPFVFIVHWGIREKTSTTPSAVTAGLVIALGGYSVWCLTSTLVRFLIPTLAILAGILALAVEWPCTPKWLRQLIWLLLIGIGVCNLSVTYVDGLPRPGLAGKWDVLTGQQSQAQFLKNTHTGYGQPYFAAMEFINQRLPRESRVLFLGESRAYYCERDFIAATTFDRNPFWIAAREAANADDLDAKLKSLGITHIFLNVFQLYSNAGYPEMLPRDVADRPAFQEFWARYLQKIYEKRDNDQSGLIKDWLLVYALRREPERDLSGIQENPILDVLAELRRQGRK